MRQIHIGPKTCFLFLLTVLLDQCTKILVQKKLPISTADRKVDIEVLGSFIKLEHIRNPHGAFGLPLGGNLVFVLFSVLAVAVILYYLLKLPKERMWSKGALSLILGGAVGNLIDRFRFREVIDFINIGVGNTRWPIFNVADIAVTVGVGLLILALFLKKEL